jgi:hypothetical protein
VPEFDPNVLVEAYAVLDFRRVPCVAPRVVRMGNAAGSLAKTAHGAVGMGIVGLLGVNTVVGYLVMLFHSR